LRSVSLTIAFPYRSLLIPFLSFGLFTGADVARLGHGAHRLGRPPLRLHGRSFLRRKELARRNATKRDALFAHACVR
jgi:hypothetical protein